MSMERIWQCQSVESNDLDYFFKFALIKPWASPPTFMVLRTHLVTEFEVGKEYHMTLELIEHGAGGGGGATVSVAVATGGNGSEGAK